jgi:hypothetical protein
LFGVFSFELKGRSSKLSFFFVLLHFSFSWCCPFGGVLHIGVLLLNKISPSAQGVIFHVGLVVFNFHVMALGVVFQARVL